MKYKLFDEVYLKPNAQILDSYLKKYIDYPWVIYAVEFDPFLAEYSYKLMLQNFYDEKGFKIFPNKVDSNLVIMAAEQALED